MSALSTPEPATVIHVIDDDASLREAMANFLAAAGLQHALYGDPSEFVARPESDAPGCLLLDIQFPGSNGLDFQAWMRDQAWSMPVILMTGHGDVPSSVRGLKAGAIDFLTKPFDGDALLAAIAAALDRDARQRSAQQAAAGVTDRYLTLTDREKQVLWLVVEGLMNKQIAGRLDLSEITVKVHRGTMMRKMAVRTVPDLVRCATVLEAEADATAKTAARAEV